MESEIQDTPTKGSWLARVRRKIFSKKEKPLVAVIRLEGIIAASATVRQNQISDHTLEPIIGKAFKKGKPRAVALVINSPGGSPVQSALIASRIRNLAKEKSIPVYTFIEDVAASGGYWLAAAGDEIYADPSSIVGSIGVISSSFGFTDLIKKIGVERRVHTAGKNKNILDPFLPENQDDIDILKGIQTEIHNQFIDYVKDRRGDKIQDETVFTGQFWTGTKAIEMGLADQIGHLAPTMKAKFGEKVRFMHYTKKKKFLSSLSSQLAEALLGVLKSEALWARYGR